MGQKLLAAIGALVLGKLCGILKVGFQQALIGSSQIASKILSTEEFVASMNVGSSA
jgi:hypothetical protein